MVSLSQIWNYANSSESASAVCAALSIPRKVLLTHCEHSSLAFQKTAIISAFKNQASRVGPFGYLHSREHEISNHCLSCTPDDVTTFTFILPHSLRLYICRLSTTFQAIGALRLTSPYPPRHRVRVFNLSLSKSSHKTLRYLCLLLR